MSATLQSSETCYPGNKEPLLEGGQPVEQQQPSYIALIPINQTAPESNDIHVQIWYGDQQMENLPYTWMIPAVFTCLCCCFPIGLVAIIEASETQKAITIGNRQKAEASSALARDLTIASAVCGILSFMMSVAYYFILKPEHDVPDF
ncbi:transmembrane protein 91-like [Ptychodera flava]|uniref:transmembrane protein 91-like n=1 Tax=Ptychodera flava TaxID=63121 RepID=UPI00396A1675